MSDASKAVKSLKERLADGTEDRLGKALTDLLENPVLTGVVGAAFDARERAAQAQEVAMGAFNIPSAADIERLTRRLRSVSQRLEGIEDGVYRLDRALSRARGRRAAVGDRGSAGRARQQARTGGQAPLRGVSGIRGATGCWSEIGVEREIGRQSETGWESETGVESQTGRKAKAAPKRKRNPPRKPKPNRPRKPNPKRPERSGRQGGDGDGPHRFGGGEQRIVVDPRARRVAGAVFSNVSETISKQATGTAAAAPTANSAAASISIASAPAGARERMGVVEQVDAHDRACVDAARRGADVRPPGPQQRLGDHRVGAIELDGISVDRR